ncbi:GntP family permease [Endozoicomonas ascidiicola]|uniref:GntP family permease n=1 Tax=Endozoicomonas ascidiicola TaxID=1698521 RepID=UPI000B16C476|nr:GntP family permease [Endozoicomonas ascidiicola]
MGGRFPALALAITGYIVSIPIYCDSGFIILNSIRKHLVKTHKASPVFLSTVLGTALYATHTLVPPTPGPLAAAANLQISDHLPLVMLSGMAVSVVAVVVGFLWGLYSQRYEVKEGQFERKVFPDQPEKQRQVGFFVSFLPVLAPILLITVSGLVGKGEDGIWQWLVFFGQPANALLVGLACCWPLISKSPRDGLEVYMTKGLEAGGKIALIVGCGGAFGLVLRASDFSQLLTSNELLVGFGLFLPFLMGAIIKTSEGMATVALITSSALIEPLLPLLGLDSVTGRMLALLACGGGSMTVAHVNDSFFWVIAEFSGMDTMTALKSITIATFLQGISVLITVQILGWWLL